MKILVFYVLFFLSINFSFAQEIIIKAANSAGKAALFSLSGEKVFFEDSVHITNQTYQFDLKNNHYGLYRIIFNNNKWLDFIYNNENIRIETDINHTLDSLQIIESRTNEIYYEFKKVNLEFKSKTDLLHLVLARYNYLDDYYYLTKEKLLKTQEEYQYYINLTSQQNPGSFISKYIHSSQLPLLDINFTPAQQLEYLKNHSLDFVDFTNDELIYSDAFTNKTIEYLSYYRNPQLPKDLLEKEFMLAVDSILNRTKVNEIVYKHIVEYMLDGFKKYGFDNVINYIVDNYVIKDDICLDAKLKTALDRRINQSRYFKVGYKVPDFTLPDQKGNLISLENVKAERVLIVFYASWCPHCKLLLPQINELYKKQNSKPFEVVAISLDTIKSDWQNFVNDNNLNWINVCDLKGWDGKTAIEYHIYATPTTFLVDKNRNLQKIITDFEDLKTYFN